MALLRTRGLLAVRLSVPAQAQDGWFRWLKAPGSDVPADALWYIDGSLIDNAYRQTIRTGFAVVVVATTGSLLAYGFGAPPAWVTTSGGAEAWALLTILRLNPTPPTMVTDYLGLRDTLSRGRTAAVAANRPLARLWAMLFQQLDDVELPTAAIDALVWMPAHRSRTAIGTARNSNGDFVSEMDWRANRLVDLLAKAAFRHRVPEALRLLLANAAAAVTFHAAMAGITSHASNNSPTSSIAEDGTTVTTLARDATPPLPRSGAWGPRAKCDPAEQAVPAPAAARSAPTTTQAGAKTRSKQKAAEEEERKEARFLHGWFRERAGQTHAVLPDAQARMAALLERVRERARKAAGPNG